MSAPESFDRKAILSLVNALYASAYRLPRIYGVSGFLVGVVLGLAANPIPTDYGVWVGPLILGSLGAGIGRFRAKVASFELKLRAQQALCDLDMADGIRRLENQSENLSSQDKNHAADS